MHDDDQSEDEVRQAIMDNDGFTVCADAIGVTQGHLSNALRGRDSLGGDKVLELWRHCGRVFDLELALERLTKNKRQRAGG